MKLLPLLAVSVLGMMLSACAPSDPSGLPPISSIPPTTTKEGSLANKALTQDATQAIRKVTGSSGALVKFVIQQPVGPVGKKAWREVWVHEPKGLEQSFILTFREDGQGSADFEIEKM